MKKPTFNARGRDGSIIAHDVPYTVVMLIVGTTAHRLALHRSLGNFPDSVKTWQVSDPISGAVICADVGGRYKGLPVSSRGQTLRDARPAAVYALDRLVERVGSEAFNARLAAAAAQYGAPASGGLIMSIHNLAPLIIRIRRGTAMGARGGIRKVWRAYLGAECIGSTDGARATLEEAIRAHSYPGRPVRFALER